MITAPDTMAGKPSPGRAFSRGAAVVALAAFIMVWSAAIFTAEARAEASVSVLCYHSFLEKKKMDPFSFTIDELNSQITQLKKEGFRFVSINDIIGGRISGTRNVLVTVDDGNRSVYEAHQKVFRPNGIRPLLGIYPNIIIHKKHYALTWEQLKELADSGCDIAAHGYFHLKINKKLHDKNPGYFKKEIFLVKKVLEEKLNRKITVFVYPFGIRDDLTIRTLREAGYRYAFTINNGRIDVPLGGGDRPFELPRYMVTRNSWKYCFNSVMRNARHRTAYKVASAGGKSMGRMAGERNDPAAELTTRLAERIDRMTMADAKAEKKEKLARNSGAKKKIEKKTGLSPDSPVPREEKMAVRGDEPFRDKPRAFARRDYATYPDIFGPTIKEQNGASEKGKPAKREKLLLPKEERKTGIAPPIQRVASGVKRDILDLDRSGIMAMEKRRASLVPFDGPSIERRELSGKDAAVPAEKNAAMEAVMVKGSNQYLSGMKKQYHGIHSKSLRTYSGFLGLVSDKIERIKHTIRKYVLSHF